MVVTVLADRPETLDLMRRHIDLLARDLQQMGYEGLSFAFGRDDRPPQPEGRPADAPPMDSAAPPAPPPGRMAATGGLDLRY